MGKPGMNSKVSEGTAEEGFEESGGIKIISPLAYEGRGGGNPDSPDITGVNANPHSKAPIDPSDPMGLLPPDATSRGKRGGAYGK